jgi:hypothetical protein
MHGLYGMPALNPVASRWPAPAHLSGNIFEATHATGRLEQLQQTLGCEIAGIVATRAITTLFLSF